MIEDKKTNRKYRKRVSRFWKFLAVYSGILIVVIAIGIIWIYGLLDDYEEGMPDVAMSKVIQEHFTQDKIEKLVMDNKDQISKYENIEFVVSYLKDAVADKPVTFSRKSGEFTDETPVYMIKAEDKTIAKAALKEDRKNSHGFSVWTIDKVVFGEFQNKSNTITITAPSNAVVTINGIKAEDDIAAEKDVAIELLEGVKDYIELPTNIIYKIEGLMTKPEIKAEMDGTQLLVSEEAGLEGTYNISYPGDDELLEQQRDYIKNINVEYGKYIINKGNLTRLKGYMTGNAKQYISDIPAVWAFLWGKTYTYEFLTNEISNLVKYSDDCFSCDINFDLYVKWNTGEKTYDTGMTYVFVKQEGKWYLADFAIN